MFLRFFGFAPLASTSNVAFNNVIDHVQRTRTASYQVQSYGLAVVRLFRGAA